MADEHTVSGAEHDGPEPSEPTLAKTPASSPSGPGPETAGPPADTRTGTTTAGTTTGPPGGTDILRVQAPAPRVQKPDVKNSVVLALAVVILVFTGISGVAIWAASSFDGGRPGITGPADGHREPPIIEPADRTRPPQVVEHDTEATPTPEDSVTVPDSPETEPPPPGPAIGAAATSGPVVGEPRAGEPQTGRDAERGAAVDWNTVGYPHDCAGAPFEVRDARPLTADAHTYVVQVRCAAGSGTAPDGLYTYSLARNGPPTLAGTLLAPGEDRIVKEFAVRDGKIHATLQGWSGDDVPRCCPDTEETRVLTP